MRIGIREIAFLAALVALPLGAWWVVFRPNSIQADEIRQELQSKEHNLRAVERASAGIEELKKEIGSLQEAMTFFKDRLPDERQIPMILEEISLLVEENKLKLMSIAPADRLSKVVYVPAGAPYAEQTILVKLEGDFMAFYRFLQALEALPRITRIQKLTVQGMTLSEVERAERETLEGRVSSKTPRLGSVKVSFLMSIFYAKNKG